MADTSVATTNVYTLKNSKSEVVGYNVRAASETEARYRAGVSQNTTSEVPTAKTTNTTETEYKHTDTKGHISHVGSP